MNEQRAVIQQMVDALDHADELLGGNDTLVMNGAAAGRWLLEQPAVQEPVATLFGSLPVYDTTPPAPQPVPVKTYHDGKPWPVQPKTWVGLTKDDVESWDLPVNPTVFEFVQFIETKIKGKNHDQ
jgi:hypothetical protein